MIHLSTFNLEKINECKHYSLIKSMEMDDDVNRYISKYFSGWISFYVSESDEVIELEKSYVIEFDNKYVGFVGSLEITSNGVLEIWYAIDRNFRNMGYGEKILGEVTSYYIENVYGVNGICLKIDKCNIVSQKVAVNNGYIKVLECDDIYEYQYVRRKRRKSRYKS